MLITTILLSALTAQAAGIPESCLRFSLDQSFPRIAPGDRSKFFVKCSSEQSSPIPGQVRPQYSDKEVKQLRDTFVAMTDCLDIDAQMMLPKLMMESGFHVQVQNPGGDAGIGQLTAKAIADVETALPAVKKLIYSSPKNSCRWLRAQTEKRSQFWKPVLGTSKCSLMAKSTNPIKNLLYTGIFHKLNEGYVNHEFAAKNIAGLLAQAGYTDPEYKRLKRIMVALGYNTGGAVAIRNLQQYLLSRIDFTTRKKQEPHVKASNLALVTSADFNFTAGLAAFNQRKDEIKKSILEKQPNLTETELEYAAQKALRNISASQYTFPEWLKVWQSHGGPGYISSLVAGSRLLDRNFGVGVCSDANNYQIL